MTTEAAPATITAWQFAKPGPLHEVLNKKATDIKLPKLAKNQVLVKVHAAALNPVDWKIASLMGKYFQKLPRTPGSDFAGEVVAVAEGNEVASRSSWLKPGARIYGLLPADKLAGNPHGALGTYTIASAALTAPIPANMSYEDAAGLALVGLTAATMAIHVRKGHKVLILGGSTSVGLVAIQMAKGQGATKVVATASGAKVDVVRERGADEVIDYRAVKVTEELAAKHGSEQFDLVFDCVGDVAAYKASPSYLKKTGAYYNIGASSLDPNRIWASTWTLLKNTISIMLLPSWLGGTPRKYHMTQLDQTMMDKLDQFVQGGVVTPKNDKIFEFDQAAEAYAYLMQGRALGKVVVKVA